MKEKQYFVYIDLTEDESVPFYVGRGNQNRIKSLDRNQYHNNIAKKHGIKRIVLECVSKKHSQEREKYLIEFCHTFVDDEYASKYATNLTKGGEDGEPCEDSRKKRGLSLRITNANPEVKKRRSEAQKIAQNRPDVKQHMCEIQKIAQNRPETKKRHSDAAKIAQNRPETRLKRIGKNNPSARSVQQIDKQTGEIIKIFETMREASLQTNTNYTKICEVCQGCRFTSGGFIWKYND